MLKIKLKEHGESVMKKFSVAVVALLLAVVMAVSVYASTNALKVSNSGGLLGHTVFLTVTLTESIAGDTMGITYTFDDKILEAVPESCKWEKNGILQDFSKTSAAGVWSTDTKKDLSGTVCTLAFKIRSDAKPGDAKVQCTLIIKNGSETVATYTATGMVSVRCDHSYNAWVSNGSLVHKHTCTLCGDTQSQMHNWDDGVSKEYKDKTVTVYTCVDCGATKQTEVAKETEPTNDHDHGKETVPTTTRPTDPIPTTTRPTDPIPTTTRPTETIPTTTRPTDPIPTTTRPTEPISTTTKPTGTQSTNPTQASRPSNAGTGTNTNQQGSGQDHEHSSTVIPSGENIVVIVPGQTENGEIHVTIGQNQSPTTSDHDHEHATTQDPHAGHDHSSVDVTPSANQEERLAAAIGIFAVLGLFLIVSILVAKKKHK